MINNTSPRLLSLPTPCGIALSSVTSDGRYLFALQPDKRVVYKLDSCARIICTYKICRRFTGITYCDGLFYAVCDGDSNRIYTLNSCFREIGSFVPSLFSPYNLPLGVSQSTLSIGPYGSCEGGCCSSLAVASLTDAFSVNGEGSVISRLSSSGRNLYYTAIAVNNGIVLEGLESRSSSQTFVRAFDPCDGSSRTVRLPQGYRLRSFLCFDGRPYAFITKNGFHGYIAAVCVSKNGSEICGSIIELPGNVDGECCEESCNVRNLFGRNGGCSCGSVSCSACEGASSNQSQVQSETTGNAECDIDELCRIYNCIKNLCQQYDSQGVCGCSTGNCSCNSNCNNNCNCNNSTCTCCTNGCGKQECYPQCPCDEGEVSPENCLPLPSCPQNSCNSACNCTCDCLKVCFDGMTTEAQSENCGCSLSPCDISKMTLGDLLRLIK